MEQSVFAENPAQHVPFSGKRDVLFSVGESVSLDKTLLDHAHAFNHFAPLRNFISYQSWSSGNMSYRRWDGPQFALDESDKYIPFRASLESMSVANACGNGFMIGSLAALLNKLIASKTIDKRVLYGSLLSSILMVFYQNYAWGKVPYYSSDLELHDNYFAHTSFNTYGRILLSTISAAIGFFGTKYTVDKISEQYDALVKKNSEEKEPLNQLL